MKIRKASQAGRFYSGDSDTLIDEIQKYLTRAEKSLNFDQPTALISPHAGYRFSGQTAAHAYKQLQNTNINRVFILAPSHHAFYQGATIFEGEYYETPLGKVSIDLEFAERLCNLTNLVNFSESVDVKEHAIEVQIPFLQSVLPDFKIIPMVISKMTEKESDLLCDSILSILEENDEAAQTLFITSSDLYHGYSYDECLDTDFKLVNALEKGNLAEFEKGIANHEFMACGSVALSLMLRICDQLGAKNCEILHQTTSYDICPSGSDYVVGYCSAAFY